MILIVVLVILAIVLWMLLMDNSEETYANIKGYEDTPAIRRAERKLKRKRPVDKMKAADINRYNLNNQEEADRLYAIALQEALNMEDPVAFTINDRINAAPLKLEVKRTPTIQSDAQNVHDSNVTDTLVTKFNRIRNGGPASPELVAEFAQTLNKKGLAGFDHIVNYPGYIEKLGASDMDMMYIIINRDRDLWPALARNLENIVVDDYAICPSGRAAQVLDSLTLIDKEAGEPIITTDILRKEMMDYCSNFVNNIEDKNAYEEDPEPFVNDMVTNLQKKYNDLPSKVVFNKIIEEIKSAF